MAEQTADIPKHKNKAGKIIHTGQKYMAHNVYLQRRKDGQSKSTSVEIAAHETGISERSMWGIVKDVENRGSVSSPPSKRKRSTLCDKLDEDNLKMIRKIVHSFFFRNEPPTINKIHQAVQNEESSPPIGRSSLWKILKKLKFTWEKRKRNARLIERPEIVLWRRKYINKIKECRRRGRKIYYLDETWINAGHTHGKVWKDKSIVSARQAFIDGLSTGLKDPSGKGKRLIILHIGSDTGFVDGGLLMFESKKTSDYHEEMNGDTFERWIRRVLPSLEPNSVIVMDNAPYHSMKTDITPNTSWRKARIIAWLEEKGILFVESLLKVELLEIVNEYKLHHPVPYLIDQIVEESGREILRLPPYHCELNPIELVWSQVKKGVADRNTTYKLQDVKSLFTEALAQITPEKWSNCERHVIDEEKNMYKLDDIIEQMLENNELDFRVNTGSSDEDSLSDNGF